MTVFLPDRGGVTSCPDYDDCGSADTCSRCKARVPRKLKRIRDEAKLDKYISHITGQQETGD